MSEHKIYEIFEGLLKIRYDRYGEGGKNAVLGWFDEEQGAILEIAAEFVPTALLNSSGWLCLDPGCGSGVLSIALARQFGILFSSRVKRIYAIDTNENAILYAQENSRNNDLYEMYQFFHCSYKRETAPDNSAIIISHNVPYHPTLLHYQDAVPIFANGGEDGQEVLKTFLIASSYHLANHGVLIGSINCRGNDTPEFFDYIRNYFPNESIYWYPIHGPCSTHGFLEYVTRWKEPEWAETIARKYPKNHAGIYVVVRDGKGGAIRIMTTQFKSATPDWQLRWDAHRTVQDMAVQKLLQDTSLDK